MQKICKKVIQVSAALFMSSLILTNDSVAQQRRPSGGGAQQKSSPVKKAAPAQKKVTPTQKKPNTVQKPSTTANGKSDFDGARGKAGNNNTNINGGGRNNNSNNNVNIDKSRGDVNINVDNSKDIKVRNTRNTVVRQNNFNRPYGRPPYVYGGYRYRCYRPYVYHPYRPFFWGPMWHPWGFFVATLATTAIIVSFADADLPPVHPDAEIIAFTDASQADQTYLSKSGPYLMLMESSENIYANLAEEYYYDEGVFYLKGEGGYTVVAAPIGAIIKTLPKGYETAVVDEESGTTNFYFGGTFYEKSSKGYIVVPPTAGTIVEHIADGGEEVKLGDVTYVKLGETYYQPIKEKGKDMYEVANVEEDK